jgi:hypothetical protein
VFLLDLNTDGTSSKFFRRDQRRAAACKRIKYFVTGVPEQGNEPQDMIYFPRTGIVGSKN